MSLSGFWKIAATSAPPAPSLDDPGTLRYGILYGYDALLDSFKQKRDAHSCSAIQVAVNNGDAIKVLQSAGGSFSQKLELQLAMEAEKPHGEAPC